MINTRSNTIFITDEITKNTTGVLLSPICLLYTSVGTMINLKPVLHVDDEGHLVMLSKVRGRKKSLIGLVDCMEKQLGDVYKRQVMAVSKWGGFFCDSS